MDMSSGSSGDGSIMANFFPLTAIILSAGKVSFGCEGEIASPWDLRRAFASSESSSGHLAILSESQIAVIVYSAVSVVERSAPKLLMSIETKQQVDVQPKAMMVEIDRDHPTRQLQMKDSKAGFTADLLSDNHRSRRICCQLAHRRRLPRRQGR
jgi:hypothetical protein